MKDKQNTLITMIQQFLTESARNKRHETEVFDQAVQRFIEDLEELKKD